MGKIQKEWKIVLQRYSFENEKKRNMGLEEV